MASPNNFGDIGLSVIGLASQYPPYSLRSNALDILSERFYPESPAMKKVLSINRYTGIDARSSIGDPDHPSVNKKEAPSIEELNRLFMEDGVPLAITAARKAIDEARIDLSQITHVVSTTCTSSGNPGFDHYVVKGLGITHTVEKVLLHGVGCSGGLAAVRTAANLALGHTMRGKPARILVVALEVSTTMVRSELDSINETQETRIGIALFSDCAGALVLSNGIGEAAEPVYELLGWEHDIIPDTEKDLGFDVHPHGWKVVLSPRVPSLASSILQPTFNQLMTSLPSLPASYKNAPDFDWAMHPGGALILTGAEKAMGISPEHMRASYDAYVNHGNSSSATIFSVMDRMRTKDMDAYAVGGKPKDYIVGCAFGPGISIEMCMLKRNFGVTGLQTPPETESEASRSDDGGDDIPDKSPDPEVVLPGADTKSSRVRDTTSGEGADAFINQALESVELD